MAFWFWWLYNIFTGWQPEDWDDKEYIPDPEDKKPEVANHYFALLITYVKLQLVFGKCIFDLVICGLCLIIYFLHLFLQGYDDIPKELPDPDAKKVVIEVPAIPINVLWILDFWEKKFLI